MKKLLLIFILLVACHGVSFAAMLEQKNQAPKTSSMDLVEFTPQLMPSPLLIRYPGKWYAREEYTGSGNAALFFTREPVLDFDDKYKVGMALYAVANYFSDSPDTWENRKSMFTKSLEKQGMTIKAISDLQISGRDAMRVDYERADIAAIGIYLKIGGHLYNFVFESPASEVNQFKNVFENMIKTLSWMGL
jgi:hypothetical protein